MLPNLRPISDHAAEIYPSDETRNLLLNNLSPSTMERLRPYLHEVDLPSRFVVMRHGSRVRDLYFVEHGLVSVSALSGEDRIEVGLVGREGVLGAWGLLGVAPMQDEVVVQVASRALQISIGEVKAVAAQCPDLLGILTGYIQYSMAQMSQTSLANGRGTLEKRLSRWLLMAHDRLEGDVIEMTHEGLATTLGVRRPGVTVALHVMEGARAIRSKRNAIAILDRDKLKEIASTGYGLPEALYARMFGGPACSG